MKYNIAKFQSNSFWEFRYIYNYSYDYLNKNWNGIICNKYKYFSSKSIKNILCYTRRIFLHFLIIFIGNPFYNNE